MEQPPPNPTCHVMPSFFQGRDLDLRVKTGGKGLNMICSIIFKVISFYPETSILLQIITNNSYDNWDYTRIRQNKRWAVCLFWLQGGKHDDAPTDRNSRLIEGQWGTAFGPPPFSEERDQQDPRADSMKGKD